MPASTVQALKQAAHDHELGTSLLQDLRQAVTGADPDHDLEPDLDSVSPGTAAIGNTLRRHPELTQYAAEHLPGPHLATDLARTLADVALAAGVRDLYERLTAGRGDHARAAATDAPQPLIGWDLVPAAACLVAAAARTGS